MKKAIILLVTLFFVMFISVLIVDNLNTSQKLIDSSNENFVNTQAIVLVNNYKDEIGRLIIKNKDNLDDIVNDSYLDNKVKINFENIKTSFELKKLDKLYNINDMFSEDKNKQQYLESFIIQSGVNYDSFKIFVEQYLSSIDKDLKQFSNSKQVQYIITEYKKNNELYEEEELRQNLSFLDFSENKIYVLCTLNLEVYNKEIKSSFVYDMQTIQDNTIKVSDFEIIFK